HTPPPEIYTLSLHDALPIFFCGSGTSLVTAEKLGRRWIGCDLGRFAIHTTRKRLLSIENCRSFEILNLGKYERQYWQGVTFGNGDRKSTRLNSSHSQISYAV